MKTTIIKYAYPTSPNAVRHGYRHTGCYTVATMEGIMVNNDEKAFASKEEAYTYADTLGHPINRYSQPR
jgi:hypothetical protein